MKKLLFVLLLTIPFIGFGQCIKGDCKNGYGVFKESKIYDGESIEYTYKGQFKNGLFHGKGERKWTDGESHVGMYKNGKTHGNGVYIYNGRFGQDTYTGHYHNGLRHGYGTLTYINGSRYEGEWKNGKKHGVGEFTFKSGNRMSGKWIDDEYVNE